MAYRRRPGTSRPSSTFADEVKNPLSPMNSFSDDGGGDGGIGVNSSSPSSLAAKAIRASSAHTDSSLSSAYGYSNLSPASRDFNSNRSSSPSIKDPNQYEYTSMKSISEPKKGLWSALTRKAKSILDENNVAQQSEAPGRIRMQQMHDTATGGKYHNQYYSHESREKLDSPTLQKGLGAITSSLNYIGGTIGNAVEEGLTIVENKTADIIQETRKHIRKKSNGPEAQNQETTRSSTLQQPQMQLQIQTDQDIQLKASRDVAMAMAAKAKLLLRELKTVKADLAFAKERCAQLEEENKNFRESHGRGNLEDDDLIRLQLETLLAEKSRLAHENAVYTRENRFLREIVEYHQLTMQDLVYLDENTEEVTEVYPINVASLSSPHSPSFIRHETFPNISLQVPEDISHSLSSPELSGIYLGATPPSFYIPITATDDTKVHTENLISK